MRQFGKLMVAAVFLGAVVGCDSADNDYRPPANNTAHNVDEPDSPRDDGDKQPE